MTEFSRCGRTDKEVSAATQVFALTIRGPRLSSTADKLENHETYLKKICLGMNCTLPNEIYVYAIAFLNEEMQFDARFDCLGRTYRYFFKMHSMNVEVIFWRKIS